MLLPDVNALVYAHREDAPDHRAYRTWLEHLVGGPHAYAVSDLVLSSVIRIVTHPRVFDPPTPLPVALRFTSEILRQPHAVAVTPGPAHWDIFADLCRQSGAKGNVIPDAYLASLAIESGSELLTTDRGFARFPGLRWRHPLQ